MAAKSISNNELTENADGRDITVAEQTLQAYCVKCKTKRDMGSPQPVYTKTGVPGSRDQCPVCGTTLFRMGNTEAHADLPKPDKIEKPVRKAKPKSKKAGKKRKRSPLKNVGKLVIVESPAKARSIGGFLGKGYTVMSSKGHVRDLPSYSLAVDVENEFEPTYRVLKDKRDVVSDLQDAADGADEIYLATDPDREGEAIAWHLVAAAKMPSSLVKRVVFHEITDSAIADAFSHPRDINMDLVNAQQARRIIDRLVGYKVSGLLRKKARKGLTAGRVQSIALRFVVEREKEIQAFVPVEYWTIDALLGKQHLNGGASDFEAGLVKIDGKTLARGSKELQNSNAIAFNQEAEVLPHLETLKHCQFVTSAIKRGSRQKSPSAPFTTSTLQQSASNRLGLSTRNTMRIAQQLYEGIDIGAGNAVGLITYMRTDSLTVSNQAVNEARTYVQQSFGKSFVPSSPRKYKTKAKGAQEAHEAIRPTSVSRTPEVMKAKLDNNQFRLYKLIWERFVASQMANAVYDTLRLEISAGLTKDNLPYQFRASGSTLKFAGFLAIDDQFRAVENSAADDEGKVFPALDKDEKLDLRRLLPDQHFTQPPPRYTEATLVRTLEEFGIGRPSTYAPTVSLIQSPERNYVTREGRQLIPTETGCKISDLLAQYFDVEMDYAFTAKMEDQLDDVSNGKAEWRPMLGDFYKPFEERLTKAHENMPKQDMAERVGRNCPDCETGELVIKYSRFGKFIGCSNFPECRRTERYLERTGLLCPECGDGHQGELVERRTKKGRGRVFYGCSRFPECEYSAWSLPKNLPKVPMPAVDGELSKRPAS